MNTYNKILAIKLQEALIKYERNTAICIGDENFTYGELNKRALAISNAILNISTGFEPIAILGSKSFMSYSGICGTLLASHAYMPLNLKFPVSRNLKMLGFSGADIIVADAASEEMLKQLLEDSDCSFNIILDGDVRHWNQAWPNHKFFSVYDYFDMGQPEITCSPEDTAYLLFTSGTSGNPKAVPVSNRNVCSYLDYVLSAWNFKEDDRFSHTFDLTFDLSVHDMMVCWLSGACLCIPQEESAFRLAPYISGQKISVWFSVPSAAVLMNKMRMLKTSAFEGIRLSFFCGEPLPDSIALKWQEAVGGKPVINLYGPTEATIAISAYELTTVHQESRNGILSIGKVFEKQKYCLLDVDSQKIVQEKGELCLSGSQVIKEYLNNRELSEKYLITLDEGRDKWYRTGDLVEEDDEGNLFFLGRIDSEVKISGYRVNLLEIDGVVKKHTGIDHVASILDDSGTARILTFIEGRAGKGENLINMLSKELPWYMIPEVIIFVDEMPLNANGKIDRNKLKQKLDEQK